MRKEPRWVVAFVRALERTGEARTAAKDAGIDHTTAYARRRAHKGFAEAWAATLAARAERLRREGDAEVEALRNAPSPQPLAREGRGAEVTMSAGKVRRAAKERWGVRKEKIFFDQLAATANASLAAEAAGVSYNAVNARRLRNSLFRAKWDAVVQSASASIDLFLAAEAQRAFDPATIDSDGAPPKVTIDQAIKISQLNLARAKQQQQHSQHPDPFGEAEPSDDDGEDVEDIRERIIRKLRRIKQRDMPDMLAQGWSYDEAHDHMVPPGWVRADSAERRDGA